MFHLRWKCKTRRVSVFHLRWKYRTHRIWMFPCRGVLHTPHRRSIYGTMNHDNWHGLRIRHSWDGVRWGVCNTPLLGKMKTRRVWVSPCRGVLHTPYRYPVRGKRKAFDDQMCKMIFGPKGRLWGVCNTPLRWRIETCRVCDMSPPDTPQTKQPDTFTHAGLHSHSDGRAVHSQK